MRFLVWDFALLVRDETLLFSSEVTRRLFASREAKRAKELIGTPAMCHLVFCMTPVSIARCQNQASQCWWTAWALKAEVWRVSKAIVMPGTVWVEPHEYTQQKNRCQWPRISAVLDQISLLDTRSWGCSSVQLLAVSQSFGSLACPAWVGKATILVRLRECFQEFLPHPLHLVSYVYEKNTFIVHY